MKQIRALLFLLILTMTFMSAYFQNQTPLKLNLDIECEEYLWDGLTEDGEWTSGEGTIITFNGTLHYSTSTASELDSIIAKVVVYDVSGRHLHEEIPVGLYPGGTSYFREDFDFEDSFYCSEQKYSISFYSHDGVAIPHRGDFKDSLNNPLYSGPTPTPNLTQDAFMDEVLSIASTNAAATQQAKP